MTVTRVSARPPILFVYWERDDDPRNRKDGRIGAAGVVLWRREPFRGGGLRWRALYQRRYPAYAYVDVETGDLTGDRVPEVLHYNEQGSGGCGAHYVVMALARSAREIFRRQSCESRYRILRRVFMINEPVGPCPVRPAGAHCFGGRRLVRMRWTGTRLMRLSMKTECDWPNLNLDPARNCERRAA